MASGKPRVINVCDRHSWRAVYLARMLCGLLVGMGSVWYGRPSVDIWFQVKVDLRALSSILANCRIEFPHNSDKFRNDNKPSGITYWLPEHRIEFRDIIMSDIICNVGIVDKGIFWESTLTDLVCCFRPSRSIYKLADNPISHKRFQSSLSI